MGTAQSIFRCIRSNGASFGLSSLYAFFKNLSLRIFKLFPFAKPRKTEPILPVVNPTNNPPFLQIQDSSSSPNTIYAPGPDLNLQLQSDQYHYSSSEDEVRASATTTTWLQKPQVSSAMETEFNESSSSSDSSSSPNTIYTPGPDLNLRLQSDHYSSLYDEVRATTTTWLQKQPVSSAMETESNESSSSSDLSSSPNTIYIPGSDLNLQLQSHHYSSSDDEVRASATTTTWLQKQPVSYTMETESNEDEGSCHIKQMDVIIDVPNLDYQSLASRDTFDVVDSAFYNIEKEENKVEEVEEDKVIIDFCVRVEGKWITHYNSYHWILLVGEGDFSFSASLAVGFGYAPNMIATSLDSLEFLKTHYRHAMSNIDKLRRSDSIVMHGIDATKIASHDMFGRMTFDRIIFNFPFAGFFKNLSREAQLRKHQSLVSSFLENAKELIGGNGEIHITHKINGFHKEWMLESLASSHRLRLIEAVNFNRSDYKDYYTKCGFGSDNNFICHPSKTYKFGLKRGSSSAY